MFIFIISKMNNYFNIIKSDWNKQINDGVPIKDIVEIW